MSPADLIRRVVKASARITAELDRLLDEPATAELPPAPTLISGAGGVGVLVDAADLRAALDLFGDYQREQVPASLFEALDAAGAA